MLTTVFTHNSQTERAQEIVHNFLEKVESQYSLVVETRDFMSKLKQIQQKYRNRQYLLRERERQIRE